MGKFSAVGETCSGNYKWFVHQLLFCSVLFLIPKDRGVIKAMELLYCYITSKREFFLNYFFVFRDNFVEVVLDTNFLKLLETLFFHCVLW